MKHAHGVERIVALCASLMLAGCVAHLHADLPEQTSFPTAASVGKGTALTLVKPADARKQRELIGVLKDEQGSVGHEVRANEDPVVWVGNSFSAGLKQAGFNVEQVNSLADASTPIAVTITVNDIFSEFVPSGLSFDGRGSVNVVVQVYDKGQEVAKRTYSGTYTEHRFPSSSADYQAIIDGAMKDMLARAIPNLARLINRTKAG